MELARLADLEAVRQLKARYLRALDTKQWDVFGGVFSADATLESGPAGETVRGRAEIVAYVRRGVERLVTSHHAGAPEITFPGADVAEGIWAMRDRLRGDGGFFVDGAGHYHETYTRTRGGRWRIASSRLERLWVESSDPAITRSLWPAAPDWALRAR